MRTIENFEYDISTDEGRNKFYSTCHLLRLLSLLKAVEFSELSGQEFGDSEGWLVVRYKDE